MYLNNIITQVLSLFIIVRFFIVLAFFLFFASPAIAQAKFEIINQHDFIEPDSDFYIKRVFNLSAEASRPVVLKVYAREFFLGHDGREGESGDLSVYPRKLNVLPVSMRSIRLSFAGERKRERYFKLFFDARGHADTGCADAQLKHSIVYVRPENPIYEVHVGLEDKQIVLVNKGNATAVIDSLIQCADGTGACSSPVVEYLLPGESKSFVRRASACCSFNLIEGHKVQRFNF